MFAWSVRARARVMVRALKSGAPLLVLACSNAGAAPGEFVNYVVNVTSLQLKTAGGASVQALPLPTLVDFAQLVDLDDAVSAGLVPDGDYTSATLVLDYSQYQINVEDDSGKTVAVTAVDSSGNPLKTSVSTTLQLAGRKHLIVLTGSAALLGLDFNLANTNTVDLLTHTVTVGPTLVASVVGTSNIRLWMHGALAAGSPGAASQFALKVSSESVSVVPTGASETVSVNASTVYSINGSSYTGGTGLSVLQALPAGTQIATSGNWFSATKTFEALRVSVGTAK